MTVHGLLAEAAAHGITVYRVGERVRWRAPVSPPADLLQRLSAHKAELLPLVPEEASDSPAPGAVDYPQIYQTLTASFGTADDLAAFSYLYDHGHRELPAELARLEGACEQLARDGADAATYRHAVETLVGRIHQIRQQHREALAGEAAAQPDTPIPTWRVIVECLEPVPGPVRLNRAETVVDPSAYIRTTLAALETAVAVRNTGRERSILVGLIDEYVERLGHCGARVRVEAVN